MSLAKSLRGILDFSPFGFTAKADASGVDLKVPTPGNTHYNSITYRFLTDNQFVVSHSSHKSHEKRIVILAFAIRRVYTRQGRQARAKRRAIREICEICVKIKHLREESLLKHKSLRHIFSAVL